MHLEMEDSTMSDWKIGRYSIRRLPVVGLRTTRGRLLEGGLGRLLQKAN
jgi:hypothetical protein